MTIFNDKRTARASVKGTTTIDHRICNSLNLSFIEYILLDYIERFPGEIDAEKLFRHKGISLKDNQVFIPMLIADGLLELTGKKLGNELAVTKKWLQFFEAAEDFDCENPAHLGFWQIFKKHGNKQNAKKAYSKARRIVDKETLHNAAIRYIKSKEGNDVFLHASTYLNPDTRHWEDIIVLKNEKDEKKPGVYGRDILKKRNPNAQQ